MWSGREVIGQIRIYKKLIWKLLLIVWKILSNFKLSSAKFVKFDKDNVRYYSKGSSSIAGMSLLFTREDVWSIWERWLWQLRAVPEPAQPSGQRLRLHLLQLRRDDRSHKAGWQLGLQVAENQSFQEGRLRYFRFRSPSSSSDQGHAGQQRSIQTQRHQQTINSSIFIKVQSLLTDMQS